MDTNIELMLLFETEWHVALKISLSECFRFSLRPLKWLRYLGYLILGVEGDLSATPSGAPVEYDISSENILSFAGEYYYRCSGTMCLIDAKGIDDRTSDSDSGSETTDELQNFRGALIEHDEHCVVTGFEPALCQASHILPRAKGNEYIQRVTTLRGTSSSRLININDPRNGILLWWDLHRYFEAGDLAFIQIPNFALQTSDIPAPPARRYSPARAGSARGRLTLHHFTGIPLIIQDAAPHGTDVTRFAGVRNWPPAVLFDYFYGVAALLKWGPADFQELVGTLGYSQYYDNLPDDDGEKQSGGKRRAERLRECNEDTDRVDPDRGQTRAADVLTRLWSMSAQNREREQRQAKVAAWLAS